MDLRADAPIDVVYFFDPRPPRGSKPPRGVLRLTKGGLHLSGDEEWTIPYSDVTKAETKKLDGIGTIVRIESNLPALNLMVPRWVLFNALVVIDRGGTIRLGRDLQAALPRPMAARDL